MLAGLRLIGFEHEVEEIKSKWLQLTKTLDSPDAYYQFAYPNNLLDALAENFWQHSKVRVLQLFLRGSYQSA